MKVVFGDEEFSYQLVRALECAPYKGADIRECLQTAYGIIEGDFESWHREWLKTAERIYATAETSLKTGNNKSAKERRLLAILCFSFFASASRIMIHSFCLTQRAWAHSDAYSRAKAKKKEARSSLA
ncbi:MAG: hypothetical protein WCE82_09630 [Halobacteriota archaeon]